jgi:hypothetical protein
MKKTVWLQRVLLVMASVIIFAAPSYGGEKKIIIFPIKYVGDPSKTYLAQTVKNLLDTRLSGAGMEGVEEEKYLAALSEKEKLGNISIQRIREAAGKHEASYAIFGSVTTAGTSSSLDLSVLDLHNGRVKPVTFSEITNEDQILIKTADMAGKIKTLIQGSAVRAAPEGPAGEKISSPTVGPTATTGVKAAPEAGKEMTLDSKRPIAAASSRSGREGIGMAGEKEAKPWPVQESAKVPEGQSGPRPLSSLKLTGQFPIPKAQIRSFEVADLDRDGTLEWIVLERKKISVFSRVQGTMVLKDRLNAPIGETFYKVSAGDINGNGRPEIYIITLYGQVTRTSVWEWSGSFTLLFRLPGNLRVWKDPLNKKATLLFQECKAEGPFSGPIYLMAYDKGGNVFRKESLESLKTVQLSTLTFIDLDQDGIMEYLGLDNGSFLCVWDRNGKNLWKSKEPIGGTNNAIILEGAEDNPPDIDYSTPLNSGLIIMDIDRDGQNEIIAVRNIGSYTLSERLKNYIKGHLLIYKIEDRKPVLAWTSEEIQNCIIEIQTDGRTLFAATDDATTWFKGPSSILWGE